MSQPQGAKPVETDHRANLGETTVSGLGDWERALQPARTVITQGDARKTGLSANSVDLVVTSPPYWAKRDHGHADQIGQESTPDGFVSSIMDCLTEWKRVLRPAGSI